MLTHLTVQTRQARELIDVTAQVQSAVTASGAEEAICLVHSPHTTAAVTVNENADPDVVTDLLAAFGDIVGDESRFRHAEGNSGAHLLTSLVGSSVLLPVRRGSLVLGTWQAVYLCEFDGPRQRTVVVQILNGA